jgi:hypothetical protein
MSSLKLPDDPSQARRVVFDTLATVSRKLRLPKGAFNQLTAEIMAEITAKIKKQKAAKQRRDTNKPRT